MRHCCQRIRSTRRTRQGDVRDGPWRQHHPAHAESAKGLEKLDLLVVADPHPTTFAVLSNRKNGTYLLPACTSFEMDGSRTASNRSLQWGEKVVEPIFESKNDYEIIYRFAKKLGFADQMFKNIKVNGNPAGRGYPARDQQGRASRPAIPASRRSG
jgi:formate dehydrogenase major subunit